MSDLWSISAITAALIALSAFFVAVEFSLIAARRSRLGDAAADSRGARAALRSASELSVVLAGAQLGITACTLLLGAITKPAVHYALSPWLQTVGAPPWIADVGGFVLALAIVTFLHLVIGEMAPKSWAIAHPERSAALLAAPMRGFMFLTRPLLHALNQAANWCLRRVDVAPVDELADSQDPETLRQLVEHSATTGTLDADYHANLSSALELDGLRVGELARPAAPTGWVTPDADTGHMRSAARESGHLRLLVGGRESGTVLGVVHVRDALASTACARELMRPAVTLAADMPIYDALQLMQSTRTHLAVVPTAGGVAVLTLTDVMHRLLAIDAA
ncbi:hemolysin family protein [Mycobacterium sp. PSTR-4-N]|uniref:hemolysin family protein n=1 Tax=Mycobacterium sp. PSTR-4-N TaxID=2917745 RepID=UPI001F14C135|nr:hemolysin family protein [Mycobacterium sp. PSTR-4-N]MCG7596258.1 hemolysin family protein [Mycobacterium sp. PSTR-4-N]